MTHFRLSRPAKITLGYFAVATAWISTSDRLAALLATDHADLASIQAWKGLAFVLVTGLTLYVLLRANPPQNATGKLQFGLPERHRAVLLTLTFVALAAIIIGFGALGYRQQADSFKSHQYKQQTAIAALKAGQIELWFGLHRQEAEQLRSDPDLMEAARLLSRGAAYKASPGIRQHFEGLLKSGRWAGIGLYSPDGRPLLLAGSINALDSSRRDLVAQTAASGEFGLNDIHAIDAGGTDFRIDFLVPIPGNPASQRPNPVLLLSADPRNSLFQMAESWPIPSDSSETLLVRREGDEVVFITPLRHAGNRPLNLRKPIATPDLPAAQAMLRDKGVFEGTDYRGTPVLAAFRPVAGTPWHIVAKTDTEEVMLPLRRQARLILLVVLLAIGIAAMFVALLWRSQLADFATLQRRSREEREALVQHFNSLSRQAPDTILLVDPDGRIVEVNEAAIASYGYSMAEFHQLNVRELRPPQALENFEREFNASGNPQGVRFETMHRRKDGSVFPVEISARGIEIQGKRYRQSFVRDITERRRHESEIRHLNKAYSTLSQTNEAIVRLNSRDELFPRICQIAVESGGYLGAWIGFIDETAKNLLPAASAGSLDEYIRHIRICTDPVQADGREPSCIALFEGRSYFCNDFLADPATAPWHDLARKYGFRASAALPLRRRNFVIGTLSLYAAETGVFDEAMRALLEEMAKDVSFALENFDREAIRKQAEESMRQSEMLFRSVVEQNIAAIFMIENGRLVFANPRTSEILGYAPGELNGRDVLALIAKADRAGIGDMLRNVLSGEAASAEHNFRGLHRNGSLVDIGAHVTRALLDSRTVVLCVAQDIGERKKAHAEIQRYMAQLENAMMSTVEAVSAMVELRDPYTSGHERRVGELASAIGAEMGLPEEAVTGLRMTGYVHDIGKISVPAEILSKPGRLSEIEFEIIKTHARSGYDILKKVEFPWPLPEVILQHHERMDGSGYPQHLKGDEIILEARIMAVADVVESMASHRPYRAALGIEKALEEIGRNRGRFYDPEAADACLRLFREKGYTLPA